VIRLLPHLDETFVVALHGAEVMTKIATALDRRMIAEQGILVGWVKKDKFLLAIRHRRPNAFFPVVQGEVGKTSRGCVIFLRYKLSAATAFYVWLWSLITLIAGSFWSWYQKTWYWLPGCLAMLLLMHSIAWANFKLHTPSLRKLVKSLLDE
jgi:hypothetical protein